jgi:GNAT superfamily N-acetyltransferase
MYTRGAGTLVASWEAYAQGLDDAAVLRLEGVAAAVFPSGPERAVYNNALLDRALAHDERVAAIEAMAAAYESAGVDRYAAWVHESDEPMRAELITRGYGFSESTRAMGRSLVAEDLPIAPIEVDSLTWSEYRDHLRTEGLPGLLNDVEPSAFHALGVRDDGEIVAAAIAFDLDADCGIYNMSTVERLRRRGLATALTIGHLRAAVERGCTSASLQSTPIAERVYASAGFRDLGLFLEHVPR